MCNWIHWLQQRNRPLRQYPFQQYLLFTAKKCPKSHLRTADICQRSLLPGGESFYLRDSSNLASQVFSVCQAISAAGHGSMVRAPGCWADSISAYFCVLHGTSAKLGGQGGGRISLRLLQAKIEDDLFSSAAINTFLSNNSSYSSQSQALESQVMSSAQTKTNLREKKWNTMPFLCLLMFSNAAEASHSSLLFYLQGFPHPMHMLYHDGVLSSFRRSPAIFRCDTIWCDKNEQKRLHTKNT